MRARGRVTYSLRRGAWIALAALLAATPYTHAANGSTGFGHLVAVEDQLYMSLSCSPIAQELWRYDTQRAELVQLTNHPNPQWRVSLKYTAFWRGNLYFTAGLDGHYELWVTDGTPGRTRQFADIHPGQWHGSQPRHFCALDDLLLFVADDGVHGFELWATDGTEAGTRMVLDIHPPIIPLGTTYAPVSMGDYALFRAASGAGPGEIWRTDGTASGTYRLDVPGLDAEGYRADMVRMGDAVYFAGITDEHGSELWRTDGTAAGTFMVRDIMPGRDGADLSDLTPFRGKLYFQADDDAHGAELWVSDGTTGGTRLLHDLVPGRLGSAAAPFCVVQDQLFFSAETPEFGRELWVTDGSADNSRMVKDIYRGARSGTPYAMAALGSRLVFSVDDPAYGEELWISDGTPSGTRLLRDLYAGQDMSEPYNTVVIGDRAYFEANDGTHGQELWSTAGTRESTVLVADITELVERQPESDPRLLSRHGEVGYLLARNHDGRWYLWRTDGSRAGTDRLAASFPSGPAEDLLALFPTEEGLFVARREASNGAHLWWVSEQSEAPAELGTVATDESRSGPVAENADGTLYYASETSSGRYGLWKRTSGTEPPSLVAEFGSDSDPHTALGLRLWADRVVLVEHSLARGVELRVVDETGGSDIIDLWPGTEGAHPAELTPAEDDLYFTADDGAHGREIWVLERGDFAARRLTDIDPLQTPLATPPTGLALKGRRLVFAANDGVHGVEPWAMDRDSGSAAMIRDIFVGPASSFPEEFTVANDLVFFRAEDRAKGVELWASDGTARGTYLIQDMVEGPGSSGPANLFVLEGLLLFSASSEMDGKEPDPRELWSTDGSRIRKAEPSVYEPREILRLGNRFVLSGTNLDYCQELFGGKYDPSENLLRTYAVKDLLDPRLVEPEVHPMLKREALEARAK